MATLLVPRRFNGPPSSGNGGWTAGALAQTLPGSRDRAITVRLRRPPPLDVPMAVTETAAGAVASHQGQPVAEAHYAESDPQPIPPVSVDEAVAAQSGYVGLHDHPFPTCFVCGTDRRSDDGLRIFSGPVDGGTAATWTPYQVTVPIIWSALDCPSGWAGNVSSDRPAVLGSITARIHALPQTSERYVVVGALRGEDGRKIFTASTLYGPDNQVVAVAEHVWITMEPHTFG